MMSMLPRCKREALRALGVTAARRSAAAENIPTIAESGLPGFEVSNWLGIVAPRRTPAPVVARLNAAVGEALANAAIVKTLQAAGVTPCGGTPQSFFEFMTKEIGRWGPIVARFHVR
jgi:tripartite-type tricarboxylate transporter receptor subunit TctC